MTRVVSYAIALVVAASGAAPAIRFDHTTHDFGAIPSNLKQDFSWAYHNDGTGPLTIIAMNPSCGCTASVADPKSVPPGGSGALKITYDPAGQAGSVRKTLTVVTNDPQHPRTILTLLATVASADDEVLPNGHPRFAGQSLLMGACASCHAAPAQRKTGEALWDAVCAMCHGPTDERLGTFARTHDDAALTLAIAYGTTNPKMPGFSGLMGGPLDEAQVASLVKFLRASPPGNR
jgi:hypothetical protein